MVSTQVNSDEKKLFWGYKRVVSCHRWSLNTCGLQDRMDCSREWGEGWKRNGEGKSRMQGCKERRWIEGRTREEMDSGLEGERE